MENGYNKRLSSLSLDDGNEVSYSKGHDDYGNIRDSMSVYSDIGVETDFRRYTLPSDAQIKSSRLPSWMTYNIPTPSASRSNSKSSKSSRSSILSDDSVTPVSPQNYSPPVSLPERSSTTIKQGHERTSSSVSVSSTTHITQPPPRTSSLNHGLYNDHNKQFTDKTNGFSISPVDRSQSDPIHKKKKSILPMITRIKQTAEFHLGKYKVSEPPEPPKQLLIPSLYIEEKDYYDESSTSHLDQQDIEIQSVTTSSESSTLISSSTSLRISTTSNDNKNCTLRRRSSCPSKPIEQIKKNEPAVSSPASESSSVSSAPSSITTTINSNNSSKNKKRESYNAPSTPTSLSSPRPPSSSLALDMMWTSPTLTINDFQKHRLNDVFDHNNELILSFKQIKPRSVALKRKTCGKREKNVLSVWHDSLVDLLKKEKESIHNINNIDHMSHDKKEKHALTRKFILREIYLTEVTFWNQLYYTKVMFHDTMKSCIQRNSPFVRESDLDLLANLPDLMQCSSKLIRKVTPYLENPTCPNSTKPYNENNDNEDYNSDYLENKRDSSMSQYSTTSTLSDHSSIASSPISPVSTNSSSSNKTTTSNNNSSRLLPLHLNADARYLPVPSDQTLIGKSICEMAEQFVVYLRCALDYKYNRKKFDQRLQHNKGFAGYQEKLSNRKETNQFFITDYFIIPIQRITRYGLLLADLEKHTSSNHPDYYYIRRARLIMTSLAVAMNKAQR